MSSEVSRITAWSVTSDDGVTKYYLPLPDGELKEISREEAMQQPGQWLGRNPTIREPEEDPEPER